MRSWLTGVPLVSMLPPARGHGTRATARGLWHGNAPVIVVGRGCVAGRQADSAMSQHEIVPQTHIEFCKVCFLGPPKELGYWKGVLRASLRCQLSLRQG